MENGAIRFAEEIVYIDALKEEQGGIQVLG